MLPTVQCPKCHGEGSVELNHSLSDVLKYMDFMKTPIKSTDVASALCISTSNACNRLKELCNYGLTVREKHTHKSGGIEFTYSRK